MTWGLAVQLTEVGDFFHRKVVTAQVQPAIDEHGSVTCAQNEAVAVQPFWGGRVAVQEFAEKHCADLCCAERQAEVAGIAFVDGVHGEATGFIGSWGKDGFVH